MTVVAVFVYQIRDNHVMLRILVANQIVELSSVMDPAARLLRMRADVLRVVRLVRVSVKHVPLAQMPAVQLVQGR